MSVLSLDGFVFAIGLPGTPELIVIGLVMLLLFGGTKLPRLARSLGQSIVEFKKGIKGGGDDDDPQALPGGDPPKQLPKDES